MLNKTKKMIIIATAIVGVGAAVPAAVQAATVYYKGSAVAWNYGRTLAGVNGYSEVQSSVYTHSSTVNGKSSGKKAPMVNAYAETFVGIGKVDAFWNCYD